MIPLITLVALWVFAAAETTSESFDLLDVTTRYDAIIKPADQLTDALQQEHVLTAEAMALRSESSKAVLARQRGDVDNARDRLKELSSTSAAQDALTPVAKAKYDEMMATLTDLDDARADADDSIETGLIDLVRLNEQISEFADAEQALTSTLTLSDQSLNTQSQSLTLIALSEDYLTRERALAAGVRAVNRDFTPAELQTFWKLATTRRFLFDRGLAQLDPDLRAPFQKFETSTPYGDFQVYETRIMVGQVHADMTLKAWRAVSDQAVTNFRGTLDAVNKTINDRAAPSAVATFLRAGLAGLLGLIAVALSVFISIRTGRSLTRDLGALRATAQDLASVRLPRLMARLKQGEQVDVAAEAPPLQPMAGTEEVRDLALAFNSVQHTAVEAAVEQAVLRESVGGALRNLARRSQSLVQRQLRMLDEMQRGTDDPTRLEELFRLDHLTTRMRRHAEGLIVLSGGSPGRTWRRPVALEDVLQAAVAEVEDYTRVIVYPMPDVSVLGTVVADLIHLFAELVENAAVYSPPKTEVSVRGEIVARGFAVEVEDRGLGLSREEMERVNRRLASPPEFNPADTDRLGLVVAGRLAARHGVHIELRRSPFGGATAIVLLPSALLVGAPALEVAR
ncbi:nitrate- and nitrite sensing domain-containing protein [Streptosporangiaceae bacterium NEAU-GS5]|nr:nitrate- and nitrite sensing domain-containing protein [Streptosporangiaceae bacterium NEAU-GS5]